MMRDDMLFGLLAERLAAGRTAALATLVRAKGSTPQQPGAKAVFTPEGEVLGTIGGGCLENEARLRALDALRDGQPCLLDIALNHDFSEDNGLICGGQAQVFIDVPNAADQSLFDALTRLLAEGRPAALATLLDGPRAGQRVLATETGSVAGDAGEAVAQTAGAWLRERRSGLAEVDGHAIYLELLLPRQRLWIAGAGHVGRAVAQHAALCDFAVTVIDDRPDLCSPTNIPWAAEHRVGEIEAELARPAYTADDYVVIVTRGHQHDAEALRAVVGSAAGYLGLIGSRRKIRLIRDGLIEQGSATPEQLDRVFAPIGLDLGAVSVHEIAVAVVAELIAVRHGRCTHPSERDWRAAADRRTARAEPTVTV